ncbi:MAG: hypothetical protein VKQ33_11095 [Candidatus Sericytochromatia bacterium]|nr:hypothetical protein [Candidatus Sericytochromatia bacterium]
MRLLPVQPTLLAAVLALPVLSQPARAASTELGTPRWDEARRALVIPYAGPFPTFSSDTLRNPPRVYFDFRAEPRVRRLVTQPLPAATGLVKWTMAPRGRGLTRVVLQFPRAAQVLLLNDATRRQLVLAPQAAAAAEPRPASTGLRPRPAPPRPLPSPPRVAPTPTRTFQQTFGHTDFKYTVGPRPKHASLDRVTVEVAAQGVSEFNVTADPANDAINFSIAITGKPRVGASPAPPPAPAPAPTARPAPSPTPLPVPTVRPTARPAPTPDAPQPEPTLRLGFTGIYPVSVSEESTAHKFDAADASVEGLTLDATSDDMLYTFSVDHHRMRVTDLQTQNRTGHDRDTYVATLGAGWRFTPWRLDTVFGGGYQVRFLNTENVALDGDTVVGTVQPPVVTSVLTAPQQLFHGPMAFTRIDAPLYGPVGFELRGGAGLLLGALDVPADIGPLFAFWGTPALYWRVGTVQASLGFDASMASGGGGYNFSRTGPVARVDLRF